MNTTGPGRAYFLVSPSSGAFGPEPSHAAAHATNPARRPLHLKGSLMLRPLRCRAVRSMSARRGGLPLTVQLRCHFAIDTGNDTGSRGSSSEGVASNVVLVGQSDRRIAIARSRRRWRSDEHAAEQVTRYAATSSNDLSTTRC